eukprot:5751987-Prymnesium_polylepis.1
MRAAESTAAAIEATPARGRRFGSSRLAGLLTVLPSRRASTSRRRPGSNGSYPSAVPPGEKASSSDASSTAAREEIRARWKSHCRGQASRALLTRHHPRGPGEPCGARPGCAAAVLQGAAGPARRPRPSPQPAGQAEEAADSEAMERDEHRAAVPGPEWCAAGPGEPWLGRGSSSRPEEMRRSRRSPMTHPACASHQPGHKGERHGDAPANASQSLDVRHQPQRA